MKIGAPNKEVTIPTGISITPDLAIKSAVLNVNPPISAEKGKTYFCRFFVGSGFKNKNSKREERTLKTKNINEAISKAKELYKNWFRENPDTKAKRPKDFDLDIAQPYIHFKVRKYKNRTDIKNNEQGERDRSKWNYMKPLFDEVDYTDLELVEDIINDELLSKLKDDTSI